MNSYLLPANFPHNSLHIFFSLGCKEEKMSNFATKKANSNSCLLARMLKIKKTKPSLSRTRTLHHQNSDPPLLPTELLKTDIHDRGGQNY